MNRIFPEESFFKTLAEINRLWLFREWFFYPGMMFGSKGKWWGEPGERLYSHEGLDIGLFRDENGEIRLLPPRSDVPAIADGIVYEISDDDFLGKSIFIRHDVTNDQFFFLHSVFAHCVPEGIRMNDRVSGGDIIATVSDISHRRLRVSSHLHLSMVWLSRDYRRGNLKWQIMSESDKAVFADPLSFLDCSYSTESYEER